MSIACSVDGRDSEKSAEVLSVLDSLFSIDLNPTIAYFIKIYRVKGPNGSIPSSSTQNM